MVFAPGQSGNPGGRPKVDNELRILAKAKTKEAFAVAVKLMKSEDDHLRLKAATVVFEYGWGKPKQELELSGDPERPVGFFSDRPLTAAEFTEKYAPKAEEVESE